MQDITECSTGQMLGRSYAVQVQCRTGPMQGIPDAGEVSCWTGPMQNRTDAGQVRCWTGPMQDRSDAGHNRCRAGQMLSDVLKWPDLLVLSKNQSKFLLTVNSVHFTAIPFA